MHIYLYSIYFVHSQNIANPKRLHSNLNPSNRINVIIFNINIISPQGLKF